MQVIEVQIISPWSLTITSITNRIGRVGVVAALACACGGAGLREVDARYIGGTSPVDDGQ
jgi:hypothetical protein